MAEDQFAGLDDEFELEEEVADDPQKLAAARAELEERCQAANIDIAEHTSAIHVEPYPTVALPSGRDKRWINLHDLDDIRGLLSVPFERYVFLGNYVAICSYEDDLIEALVRHLGGATTRILYRRLLERPLALGDEDQGIHLGLQPQDNDSDAQLKLGSPTDALKVLSRRSYIDRDLALTIEGSQASQHDQAVSLLERISNSLFFQVDLQLDIPLTLARERRPRRRKRRSDQAYTVTDLEFPRREYDEVPMSLYWYARSAIEMPLLQFLAYYQVVEYYFPTYSHREASRRVRNILRDPTFRSDKDADIGRVLATLSSRGGSGFGDERTQLRATLQECIDPAALREFLTGDEDTQKHFASKNKSLTSRRIPVTNPTADLRNDVADRTYDIRCKIVHTKGEWNEGEVEILLPFSKEVEQLQFDIELIQYVARQVLIAASTPLQI
jgi:hypothetical protein